MSRQNAFPGWDWDDPDGLEDQLDRFSADVATCRTLEPAAGGLPFDHRDFTDLGLTGIEFAAFRTAHPGGLGTDLTALRSPGTGTEPGTLYRVDGDRWFTQLDISKPLPFADASVDWVYAEHLIEHVTMPVAVGWLREARRVLRPGGVLRITTPDLARYLVGYATDDGFLAKHRRRLTTLGFGPPMPARPAFLVNQIFRHYGHQWIYDLDELRHVLTRAGFEPGQIRPCAYREGARADVADLDTAFRTDETVYVEADR
ncbi:MULTISPECIES: methyltransferase domain-containing protein [unclassified Streptomyces]|uniref:methyltransferase domain-containing protein n=1 Tax=Streptomycetaceae TaxID=2062 RepID=UPI002E76ECA5|nr:MULTISPECIES: methyltransferase domain-containing protein [unclassified Streptomyces]MED7953833.1 methyltransferase domain-containing protein [Streptomyces sp. BE303]MEE1825055.1 methyltransferase domain-containing protein [Streptomyces sp. BE20]